MTTIHVLLRSLVLVAAAAPPLVLAQYSETKMGEYLHYAVASANGGIYAGYDTIGYPAPSLYKPSTGWVDLPDATGFNTAEAYSGYSSGISHDGSIVAGYTEGVTPGGTAEQFAAYWVNGVENIIPAPPDDPSATSMSVTAISGDGSTLLVQDSSSGKVESYVFNIASKTFASLGFLAGNTIQQTYGTAISNDGKVVAGYCTLDNGNSNGVLWNATSGLTDLGIPAAHPNTVYLEPTCISDDGKTLFGRLTELNGWVGFRYNTTTGFQDLGDISPSACTADGTETIGIENLYFPAVWSVGNGGGYVDDLVNAHGTTQALGTVKGPVTISPDGSAITATGPDAYLTDQTWYGAWQVTLPVPLATAAIAPKLLTFSTPYITALQEPTGTLTQYAEFATGATVTLHKAPSHASSFVLNSDGSFNYTPKPGYRGQTDSFTYQLVNATGTGNTGQVQISVGTVITASFSSAATPAIVSPGYAIDNSILSLTLTYAPNPGDVLTVIQNTGGSPINGTFTNLPDGGTITASYNGVSYTFLASYEGGSSGYDLTLTYQPPVQNGTDTPTMPQWCLGLLALLLMAVASRSLPGHLVPK